MSSSRYTICWRDVSSDVCSLDLNDSARLRVSQPGTFVQHRVLILCFFFLFFFQAEDGIRDIGVTGVQTCALPIYLVAAELASYGEPVTLVGHSMGGKVAMTLALRRPELLRALVVVDIAPVDYPLQGGRTDDPDEEASPFAAFIEAMKAMDLGSLASRADADAALQTAVPSRMVRSFLLQSLVREGTGGDGWRWRLNLDLLGRDLGELRGFPEPPPGATFDGPVLWIAGANSTYVLDEDRPHMDALFPATRLVRIKNAGHWVHSEQPEVFLETLRRFLERVE